MIIITGGTGYVGKNIAYYLLLQGEKVVLLDNFANSSCKSLYDLFTNLDKVNIPRDNLKFYNIDLSDRKKVNHFFFYELSYIEDEILLSPLQGIIHCAGHKSVPDSFKNPFEYYRNNFVSTLNIIECLQIITTMKKQIIPLIFSSTTTVYGNNKSPVNENMECKIENITSPYGKTKYMIEEILRDCSKYIKTISLRYFNPIGCFQNLDEEINEKSTNIIPTLIKKIKNNEVFHVFGNDYETTPDGTCIRDYIDVRDLAKSHHLALVYARNMEHNYDIFNIGTEKGTSVKELLNMIEKVHTITIKYDFVNRREGDLSMCFSNSEKAKKILKWNTEFTLEDSIRSIKFLL